MGYHTTMRSAKALEIYICVYLNIGRERDVDPVNEMFALVHVLILSLICAFPVPGSIGLWVTLSSVVAAGSLLTLAGKSKTSQIPVVRANTEN